jgi:hypothetical protein
MWGGNSEKIRDINRLKSEHRNTINQKHSRNITTLGVSMDDASIVFGSAAQRF